MRAHAEMKFLLAVIALTLALAAPARAIIDPKTIETGWNWNLYSSSFTGVTSQTFDVAGLGSLGVSTSNPKANVTGFSYSIYGQGGALTYTVSQTTKTFSPAPYAAVGAGNFNSAFPLGLTGVAPIISTTTPSTVPSGVQFNATFEARVLNPVFTFSNLSAAATYFIYVTGGTPVSP